MEAASHELDGREWGKEQRDVKHNFFQLEMFIGVRELFSLSPYPSLFALFSFLSLPRSLFFRRFQIISSLLRFPLYRSEEIKEQQEHASKPRSSRYEK